jgi:uncharacterized OB-fold protein
MTDQAVSYPSPHADHLSAPYWDGTKRGVLVIQRCTGCGKQRHYPQVLCVDCYSDDYDWIEASGHGTVHSWTVCHHAFHPGFASDLPYTLVTVDLEEGVRSLGRFEGGVLAIGLSVRATFPRRPDGFGMLTFTPA